MVRVHYQHFLWHSGVHGARGELNGFPQRCIITAKLSLTRSFSSNVTAVRWTGGRLGYSCTRCSWANPRSVAMTKMRSSMPFWRMNHYTPSRCPEMQFLFFRRFVSACYASVGLLTAYSLQLLTRDPNRRLGSGKGDAEEIKRQPFFKDVSWDDVFNKRIPPPYFPTIVSPSFYPAYRLCAETAMGLCRTAVRTQAILMKNSRKNNQH